MAQKARAEQAFRDRIAADPKLHARFGGVWDELAKVAQARRELEAPLRFHSSGGHPVLQLAERVVAALASRTSLGMNPDSRRAAAPSGRRSRPGNT